MWTSILSRDVCLGKLEAPPDVREGHRRSRVHGLVSARAAVSEVPQTMQQHCTSPSIPPPVSNIPVREQTKEPRAASIISSS